MTDSQGTAVVVLTPEQLEALVDRAARRAVREELRAAEGDREVDLDGAAELLGLHRDTVRRRAKAGELPHRRAGRGYRFRVGDLSGVIR